MLDDEAWFAELYRRRYGLVYAYAARRVGTEPAREVASEVFLVVWRRGIRLTEDTEIGWLLGSARKVVANLLRAQRRRTALLQRASTLLAAGVVEQLDPMNRVDDILAVREALTKLSPTHQEALLHVEWEGVDTATGAEIAGCSPSTFKVRLHRARRRLAELLADQPTTLPEPVGDPS